MHKVPWSTLFFKVVVVSVFGGGTVRLCGFTSPSGFRIVIVSFHPLPFKYLPSRATMLALISWRAKEREREAMKKKGIHGEFRDGTVLSNQNGKRKTERSLQLELPRWKRHQSLSLSHLLPRERSQSEPAVVASRSERERERERVEYFSSQSIGNIMRNHMRILLRSLSIWF